jgi:hypothetical protein
VSIARARKEASRVLGIEMEKRFRALAEAVGEQEIGLAAIHLGALFNDNIEFVIWALKKQGGLEPKSPELINRDVPAMPKMLERLNEGTAYL